MCCRRPTGPPATSTDPSELVQFVLPEALNLGHKVMLDTAQGLDRPASGSGGAEWRRAAKVGRVLPEGPCRCAPRRPAVPRGAPRCHCLRPQEASSGARWSTATYRCTPNRVTVVKITSSRSVPVLSRFFTIQCSSLLQSRFKTNKIKRRLTGLFFWRRPVRLSACRWRALTCFIYPGPQQNSNEFRIASR